MDTPLAGRRIAVLVETEFIWSELDCYIRRFPELGASVDLLSYLWGAKQRELVPDIDNPDRPIRDLRTLTVEKDVADANPDDYDLVIMVANYCAIRFREIMPMGSLGGPDEVSKPPAVQFFARAMENKRIIKGALCHALLILTPRPDLLKGRKVMCHTVVLADIINAGGVYTADAGHVVVDDDLVTARSAADLEPYFQALVTATVERASPLGPAHGL
jgi:protease I